MKHYLADKPVRAGVLRRVECTGYEGSRVHCLYVDDEAGGEAAIPLHDGPLWGDAPSPGDMVIDHGDHITWMEPSEFEEAYQEVVQ